MRANATSILGKHAVPCVVQADPSRRLPAFPTQRHSTIDHNAIEQAQRRRPVSAIRTNTDCGRSWEKIAYHAGLFEKFTDRSCPRRLTRLNSAARSYQTTHTMLHEQHVAIGTVEDPDLCCERIRQLRSSMQPRAGIIELRYSEPCVGDRRIPRQLVDHLVHPMPISQPSRTRHRQLPMPLRDR